MDSMAPLFAPRRRYLRSVTLPRASGWPGAFCCKWEGFEVGWKWAYSIENRYWCKPTPIGNPSRVEQIEACPGVYAFLTRTLYVLYVGKASSLGSRIWQSLDSLPRRQREIVKYYAVCRAMGTLDALKMERALIYYYVPPWNRAIGYRPPQRGVDQEPLDVSEAEVPSVANGLSNECARCQRIYPPEIKFCTACEVAL